MPIVLKGERKIEAGGVTFTVRPEKLGDVILGRQAAEAQGLEVSGGSVAALAFSLLPRITAWDGVSLGDGTPAPCTPENISELFEQEPKIMFELISQAFGNGEASVSGNLQSSEPGSGEADQAPAEAAGIPPERVE
jgi:hypothetical protein